MVNIMKFWTPLPVMFLCMVLLSVLGGVKERYNRGELFLDECWGEPTIRDCSKRCSRSFRCVKINHTCCWTYCGNICWENTISSWSFLIRHSESAYDTESYETWDGVHLLMKASL
ncbi:protein WFDC11 isoform 1-T2 [Dama dama]|uniref:protein WFDC11 isoform X1 n=1 Tax=Dama dama TaxID=30532 RepID=UPI002A35E224|nr:protein WFDC11 isoform X1 [Dama dama]XP_060981858.1 protein WFDC11 isoform X1 [Dama dama]